MNLGGFYSGDGNGWQNRRRTSRRRKSLLQITARVRNSGMFSLDLCFGRLHRADVSYVLWDSCSQYYMERGAAPGLFAVYGITDRIPV